MVPLFLVGCSVNDEELVNSDSSILELNATYISDGCTITTFDFATMGNIEVRNDWDSLYVTVNAIGGNTISAISLDIANEFSQFPTVGKGNLQPQKMEHQINFEVGVEQYTFAFPLSDFNESMAIASYTTFNGAEAAWAGDITVKQGNWVYFDYQLKEYPVYAGPDNSRTITLSAAKAMPSWDEVRKLYAGMLAPGVDSKSGTYNPSIWDLINDFNSRENQIGEYTTTYTLGSGDCTDSVELTMIVVPDGEVDGESFN